MILDDCILTSPKTKLFERFILIPTLQQQDPQFVPDLSSVWGDWAKLHHPITKPYLDASCNGPLERFFYI